jgi:hypothetical protein
LSDRWHSAFIALSLIADHPRQFAAESEEFSVAIFGRSPANNHWANDWPSAAAAI